MKKLLFLPVLVFLFILPGFKSNHPVIKPRISKSDSVPPPMFCPVKSAADASLSSSEAVFKFQFCAEYGKPIHGEIKTSYNGVQIILKGDKNGNALLKVKPGKYFFQFFYNENYYEIYSDSTEIKPGFKNEVAVYFRN